MNMHTPKPWKARKVGGAGFKGQIGYAIDYNEDQEQVVDFVYEEADAHLISAAPELLEALDEAISMLGSRLIKDTFGYDWHEKATAAIAKARGEA
jgi:hypothetical protein